MKKFISLVLSCLLLLSIFVPANVYGDGDGSKYEIVVKEEVAKVLTPKELLNDYLSYMQDIPKLKGNAFMDTKIQQGDKVKQQSQAKWKLFFTEETNVAVIDFEGIVGEDNTNKSKLFITTDKIYMNDAKTNETLKKNVWTHMDLNKTGDTFTSYLLVYLGASHMQSVFDDFVLSETEDQYILTLTKEKEHVQEFKQTLVNANEYNTLFGIDDLTTKFQYVYYIEKGTHKPIKSEILSESLQKVQDTEIKGIHTLTINYESTEELGNIKIPQALIDSSISSEEVEFQLKLASKK